MGGGRIVSWNLHAYGWRTLLGEVSRGAGNNYGRPTTGKTRDCIGKRCEGSTDTVCNSEGEES